MFSLIAAIGKNRELGKNGQLLWRLPGDLKFFKEITMGHPILMGRKTFESLPGMLPGRKHYVISRNSASFESGQSNHFSSDALKAAQSSLQSEEDGQLVLVSDLQKFIAEHADTPEEIFVIGGGMVYWEMWKHCQKLYLTEVDAEDKEADTFFPDFDKSLYKRSVIKEGSDHGIDYVHALYSKK